MTTKSNTIKKKALLEALEKSMGVVTPACKSVGIARSTYYEWYNNDADFKVKVNDLQEVALDFAESKFYQLISEGDKTCVIFHLKTKGKNRGYVERSEIDMSSDDRIQIEITPFEETENHIISETD